VVNKEYFYGFWCGLPVPMITSSFSATLFIMKLNVLLIQQSLVDFIQFLACMSSLCGLACSWFTVIIRDHYVWRFRQSGPPCEMCSDNTLSSRAASFTCVKVPGGKSNNWAWRNSTSQMTVSNSSAECSMHWHFFRLLRYQQVTRLHRSLPKPVQAVVVRDNRYNKLLK